MDSVKIISLEIENVKRVRAVSLAPSANGLTVIGGKNNQGKSSVLDAIMSALGGEKFTPTDAVRVGAEKGEVTITLSNGIVVTRSYTGKGTYLKVSGGIGGQKLLNEFINSFALDIGGFLAAPDRERTKMLMNLVGLDLTPLNERRKKLYDDRESIGRLATRAKKHAEDMPFDEVAGLELQTPTDIMNELQAKLAANAENHKLRQNVARVRESVEAAELKHQAKKRRVDELKAALLEAEQEQAAAAIGLDSARKDLATAQGSVVNLVDEDTSAIKAKIAEIDEFNGRVRKNWEREKAMKQADEHKEEYRALTHQIEEIDAEKSRLLSETAMPLPGLAIEDDALVYNGRAWDCMSHSEQLRVSTAICRAIKPSQGFVLLDKLEAMDIDTLFDFHVWLEAEGIQAIATRVSSGDECSIIIEDGSASVREAPPPAPGPKSEFNFG
jgi:DNA repair exonuclease SbcCD ATPase subunit